MDLNIAGLNLNLDANHIESQTTEKYDEFVSLFDFHTEELQLEEPEFELNVSSIESEKIPLHFQEWDKSEIDNKKWPLVALALQKIETEEESPVELNVDSENQTVLSEESEETDGKKLPHLVFKKANSDSELQENNTAFLMSSPIIEVPLSLTTEQESSAFISDLDHSPEVTLPYKAPLVESGNQNIELNNRESELNLPYVTSDQSGQSDQFGESGESPQEGKSKSKHATQLSSATMEPNGHEFQTIEKQNRADDIQQLKPNIIEYDLNLAENFEKELGGRLVNMIKENDHEVTLKIDPPELGKMDIVLKMTDEKANLSFYTTHLHVKSVIESSMVELKNIFNQQNLSLGDVNIFHQASDGGNKHSKAFHESRENERLGGVNNIRKDEDISQAILSSRISVFV